MATACKNYLNTDKYFTKDGLAPVTIKQRLLDNLQKEVRWFEERWRKSISKLTTSIELFKYKTNKNANSQVGTSIMEEQKIARGEIIKPVSTFNKNDLKFYIIENTLPSSVALPPTVILKQLGESLQLQLSKLSEMKNRRVKKKNKQGLLEQCEKHTIIEIKHSIVKYYKEKYNNLIAYSKTNQHFLKHYTTLDYKGDNNKLASYDQCFEQNIPGDKTDKSKIGPVHESATPHSKNYVDAEIRESKALDSGKLNVLFSRQEPAERDTVEKKKQCKKRKRCKNNLKKHDTTITPVTPSQIINKMNNDRNALLQNIFAHKLLVKDSKRTKHHIKGQVNKHCHRNCLVQVKDVSSKQTSKKTVQSKGLNSKQNQSTTNKSNGQCKFEGSNKTIEKESKKLHRSMERRSKEVKKKSGKHKSDRVDEHKKKKKRQSNLHRSRRKANDELKEMLASPYMPHADKRAFLTAHRAQQHKQEPVITPKPVNDCTDKHLRLVNKLYNEYSHTKKLVLEEDDEDINENGTKNKETVRKSVYQENQHSRNDMTPKSNHSALANKRVCYIQLQNHGQEIENNHKNSRSAKDCKVSDRKLGGLYRSVETLIFRNNNISNFDLNAEMNDHKLGKPVWLDPDPRPNGFGPLKPRPHATYQKPLKPRTVQEFVQFLGDPNANLYSIGCL